MFLLYCFSLKIKRDSNDFDLDNYVTVTSSQGSLLVKFVLKSRY